ncbi:polyprenol phosphomannose-dependent alpha 1,6 mannosyltransferase MptB [Corynebacterium sp. 335C]
MTESTPGTFSPRWLRDALPKACLAGSRSAALHQASDVPLAYRVDHRELRRFTAVRWLGTLGSILIMVGGLGAGATPVVGNDLWGAGLGVILGRMLQSTTIVALTGMGMLVLAWLGVGAFVYAGSRTRVTAVDTGMLARTFAGWVLPMMVTAPLFTQDIYSYLAQGAIVDRGMDPYVAGPVDLLGARDPLARSVPVIWSHSPSPYGPVALSVAWAISAATGDHIVVSVLLHRVVSVAALFVAAWALVKLSQRCGVAPQYALWLGILNPLTLLHLVGGIHNESILVAFLLLGIETCLRALHGPAGPHGADPAVERAEPGAPVLGARGWALFALGCGFIAMAGLVKVTGFVGLGFVGMALARRWGPSLWSVVRAAVICAAVAAVVAVGFSVATGLGLGWVTSQGGATSVRSWMSLTTLLGMLSGAFGMLLGIGDVSDSAISLTHALGLALAGAWMLRMLWATFRGRIHPLGGYGLAMFVTVVVFPVVHPWYLLWALVPLSAWANRGAFRVAVVAYSALFSFFVLPRGLGLPPLTVVQVYVGALVAFVACMAIILAVGARRGVFRIR